ncbi:MAG: cell division protein FtsA [Tenericutes bacterium]|nr:cell division protein FtsA [Mycoplasmatota bacterium]
MKEIISSLDIGSSTVKLIVGEVYKNEVHVLAVSEVKSKGVKKGIIVSPEETLISLKEVFSRCEEMLNIKINNVVLTVPSYYAEFIISEGESTITNENGIVQGIDIVRVLQGCVYNKVPNNKELVSIMPVEFIIDDNKKVKDPKGMNTTKLKCKAVLSLAPKKNVYAAASILESIGVNIVDINFGSVADYYEFKTDEFDKKNTAVINIGSEKTEVSIFKKGILIETENIEIGGKSIDRDICYIYDINRKNARNLKEKFALASRRNASTSWSEDVLTNSNEDIKINQYEISEIIYSRIKEILDLSKKQINILTKLEISYIIITGGATEVNDFNLVVEEVFGKELNTFKVKELGCRHNKYSSALGLIKYYHSKLSFRNKLAYTVDESLQQELLSNKKINSSTILGKIYGYFFNN